MSKTGEMEMGPGNAREILCTSAHAKPPQLVVIDVFNVAQMNKG